MKPAVEFQPNGALCHRCLEKLPEDQRDPETYESVRGVVNLAVHAIYGEMVCHPCMLPHERLSLKNTRNPNPKPEGQQP